MLICCLSFVCFETYCCYVAGLNVHQVGLKLVSIPSPSHDCWGHGCVSPHLAVGSYLTQTWSGSNGASPPWTCSTLCSMTGVGSLCLRNCAMAVGWSRDRSVLHCSQVLAHSLLLSKLPVNGLSTPSQGTVLETRMEPLLVHWAESGLCSLRPFTYRKGQEQKLVEEHGVFESSAWLYGFPDLPEEWKMLDWAAGFSVQPLLSDTEMAHYLSLPTSHCLSSSLAPSLSAGQSTWHLPSEALSTEEASRHSHLWDAHQEGVTTVCCVPGMSWLQK